MEYRHIVSHLAECYDIIPKNMDSFKAQLHCLRKAGIPNGFSINVGRGKRADFSDKDLEEMHVGYSLMLHGFTPNRILDVIQCIRNTPYWSPLRKWNKHLLIVTRSDGRQRVAIKSYDTSFEYLSKMSNWNGAPTCSSVLNLRDVAESMRYFAA